MDSRLQRRTFRAMGSPCELQLYLTPEQDVAAVMTTAMDEALRLERKYTRYQSSSVTSAINAAAGSGQAVALDEETDKLLHYADTLYQQSDGLFDITSGILRRAWDFKSGRLPPQKQIDALLPLIGWHRVVRDERGIRLPEHGMELDFGGYVKEYAADCVAEVCHRLGVRHGLVNLGGDVKLIGPHPDGKPWQVGVQHPRHRDRAIATVALSSGALTTSGDYERFMLVDGRRYCHLLNPKTGWSIQPRFSSISIIAEQCIVAGALSTIAMLKSGGGEDWAEDLGVPYLSVDQQMQLGGKIITL